MLFSYSLLQEHIKEPLPKPSALADALSMHAFEVDAVEKKEEEWVLDVSILPHRSDCLGHRGLAREIAAILSLQLKSLSLATVPSKTPITSVCPKIQPSLVSRYSALSLAGISMVSSPLWMRKRLKALGINAINAVVDTTNYIMVELGQPLHAFDLGFLERAPITIREARQGEEIALLDDQVITLPRGAIVMNQGGKLIDLAGIKGGKGSSVQEETLSIFLQSAVFDREHVYRARKTLRTTTLAADIYAKGVDPEGTFIALQRALFFLQDSFPHLCVLGVLDEYKNDQKPSPISFPQTLSEQILGIRIPSSQIKRILKNLGCAIAEEKKDHLRITPPSWRPDLLLPQDIVEEVGRIYGYEHVPAIMPTSLINPPDEADDLILAREIREVLKVLGMSETYTYSFLGASDPDILGYTEEERSMLLEIEEPVSQEFRYLRPTLIDTLLKAVAVNRLHNKKSSLKLFEIGSSFAPQEKGEYTCVIALPHDTGSESLDQVKGVAESLMSSLGIENSWIEQEDPQSLARKSLWHNKRTGKICAENQTVGIIGEISPHILLAMGIQGRVAAFSVDREIVSRMAKKDMLYSSLPKFPSVTRDISLLVPKTISVRAVTRGIESAKESYLTSIELFDSYEGEGISQGQKSLAFHLVFQSDERTLTNNEVDEELKNIVKKISQTFHWQERE
ncbi:MAG: phenylalanine--tRNA ligase subunit beta [bacterium]|nr:phenylalanine--tRNA ligase subunit beta [bacterium]